MITIIERISSLDNVDIMLRPDNLNLAPTCIFIKAEPFVTCQDAFGMYSDKKLLLIILSHTLFGASMEIYSSREDIFIRILFFAYSPVISRFVFTINMVQK
jgi:hypothetical protein